MGAPMAPTPPESPDDAALWLTQCCYPEPGVFRPGHVFIHELGKAPGSAGRLVVGSEHLVGAMGHCLVDLLTSSPAGVYEVGFALGFALEFAQAKHAQPTYVSSFQLRIAPAPSPATAPPTTTPEPPFHLGEGLEEEDVLEPGGEDLEVLEARALRRHRVEWLRNHALQPIKGPDKWFQLIDRHLRVGYLRHLTPANAGLARLRRAVAAAMPILAPALGNYLMGATGGQRGLPGDRLHIDPSGRMQSETTELVLRQTLAAENLRSLLAGHMAFLPNAFPAMVVNVGAVPPLTLRAYGAGLSALLSERPMDGPAVCLMATRLSFGLTELSNRDPEAFQELQEQLGRERLPWRDLAEALEECQMALAGEVGRA